MNFRMIAYIIGKLLKVEAGLLLLPMPIALIYGDDTIPDFALTILLLLAVGVPLSWKCPKNRGMYVREGFFIVGTSWLLLSFFGALPFIFSGEIPRLADAFFETASGFTTTGASILTDVEVLPRCILFWRSFTHWIGGMGILVFILSILPLSGGYHMHLMKAESPGPEVSKLAPRVQSTAKILYGIYLVLTVVEVILLLAGQMPLFDALTTAFGTAGTGGFGIKNDSITSYSPYIQYVVTIFMILFGVNFNAYFLILMGRAKQLRYAEEVWTYLGIIAASVAVIAVNTYRMYQSVEETFRHAAFQVASIITTTGFATTDFDQWPQLSRTILVMLMFIGACAGSTGGGIKVSRLLILVKSIRMEFHYFLHPREVRCLWLEGHAVSSDTIRSVNVFLITYMMVFAISGLLISLDNQDLVTNFTAVAATLNNIGPGLAAVGPTQNFSHFSVFSKLILTFDMLAGRLELFPVLLIFFPRTWKRFS